MPDQLPWETTDPQFHARLTDPGTAHAAARALNIGPDCIKVLTIHANYPDGLTDEVLNRLGDFHDGGGRKRRADLMNMGLIFNSGRTETGRRSGKEQVVWCLTEKGDSVCGRLGLHRSE